MELSELTRLIKQEARLLGFPLAGVTSPDPPPHLDFFRSWLEAGYHASMDWIAADRSLARRANPKTILPECQSILVLGCPYPQPRGNLQGGNIAAYALNQDYHDVLGNRLERLVGKIEGLAGRPVANRCYVDSGPILEKELAMRSGLGWIGKNTTLINRELGSYVLLAEILLDLELTRDLPAAGSLCGSCTRCLDTCPTGALVNPYTLDANRCISYLTIEHREEIPPALRPLLGDWVFGCDICQLVCPWNKPDGEADGILEEFEPRADLTRINLIDELGLTQDQFSARFKASPIKRAKRRGYLRNIALALGNLKDEAALPALEKALDDPEPLVREAADWARAEILQADQYQ